MPLNKRVGTQVSACASATVMASEGGGKLSINAIAWEICTNLTLAKVPATKTQTTPVMSQARMFMPTPPELTVNSDVVPPTRLAAC